MKKRKIFFLIIILIIISCCQQKNYENSSKSCENICKYQGFSEGRCIHGTISNYIICYEEETDIGSIDGCNVEIPCFAGAYKRCCCK